MKAWRKRLLWSLLVLIAIVATVFAARPRPILAEIATVEAGPLVVTLDEEGETRVRERFVISAPVAGKVLRIELEPGDRVQRDDTVLASFAPSAPILLDARSRAQARANVEAAKAALGRAQALVEQSQAELAFSHSEVERYRKLAEEGIVSVERLDSSQLELETREEAIVAARFQVSNSRAALEVARARFVQSSGAGNDGTIIRILSPVDGIVLERLRESEAVVPAGEPLLEIGDPQDLEIVADYLSRDAVRIRRNQRVLIERWGGEGVLEGRVRRVEPSGFTKISALGVEEQRVNVVVDLSDPPEVWEGLGDGFRVETRVVVWEGEKVVKIPTGALFRRQDSWAVFAVVDGKAQLRLVEVGERNARAVQILSGVETGDEVIVHPSDAVSDGKRVRLASS